MILVTGVLPYDSGKTTFAASLIEEAVERGIDVGVSKPFSSFNGWYHYRCLVRSSEVGMLIGEDIQKLHEKARSKDPIDVESPVVSLLLPPDPEKVGWNSNAYTSMGFYNLISVVRVTDLRSTNHYCVYSNIVKAVPSLRKRVEEFLGKVRIRNVSVENIERILLDSRMKADKCVRYLNSKHEMLVVESYSNAAVPTAATLEADGVFAVAPGKAAFFSGRDYRKAVIALSDLKEPWSIRAEDVLSLLNPLKVIELEPGRNVNALDLVLN